MPRDVELPPEILAAILDHLPVPDLCRAASASLLLKDLVDDERRWIAKLKAIGVWFEEDARSNMEEETFRRQEKINGKKALKNHESATEDRDTRLSEDRTTHASRQEVHVKQKRQSDLLLFTPKRADFPSESSDDPILTVLCNAKSVYGSAKQEFAKIWVALHPYYDDLGSADNPSDPILFRQFRTPEDQATMLQQLSMFGRAKAVSDWPEKRIKVHAIIDLFENAAIREFEIAYDNRDEVAMKRYAQVLDLLNGGQSCVKAFCRKNVLFNNAPPNPFECFDSFSDESAVNLAPMGQMTKALGVELLSQKNLISRIFHESHEAWNVFVEKTFTVLLAEYIDKLTDYAQQQSPKAYLLAMTGSYQYLYKLVVDLSQGTDDEQPHESESINGVGNKLTEEQKPDAHLLGLLQGIYEAQVSFYLEEEMAVLRDNVVREVVNWDKRMEHESRQTEQLFLSGVNREIAKKNFLQSFTKVILMPVNVVGSVMPFPARPSTVHDETQSPAVIAANNEISSTLKTDLPTTELAARAAIMNSGLARIKRLLSLEVALQLIHTCKESIDRARSFIKFERRTGEEAREQCEAIFSVMLQGLGSRHIQIGFDMALASLKAFNPRDNKEVAQVQPLVDFLELVHVGDLMQQMIHVFYNQELSGIVDKTDFLSPAVKEKKKFELMIDEKVAEGLNRGIDVLMEQVDYLLITTQKPTDFKPWLVLGQDDHLDLRESDTAVAVVECLSRHMELLRGSTDKGTLDVFFQEVGVRFFGSLCKHVKRQSITVEGGLKLISDLNYYHAFITALKQPVVTPYFEALKELGNIYIISGHDGKAVGQLIGDIARFGGILRPEDVYEFAERRADWPKVKKHVDRVFYGTKDCIIC